MLCVAGSLLSVKKGVKLGRGTGGMSDFWGGRGRFADVVCVWGCGGDIFGAGGREGEVEVGGAGEVEVNDGWRGGSLPGSGGMGIEASADMI